MLLLALMATTSLNIVLLLLRLADRWRAEEREHHAYWRGRREGWHEAMRTMTRSKNILN